MIRSDKPVLQGDLRYLLSSFSRVMVPHDPVSFLNGRGYRDRGLTWPRAEDRILRFRRGERGSRGITPERSVYLVQHISGVYEVDLVAYKWMYMCISNRANKLLRQKKTLFSSKVLAMGNFI